MNLKNMRECDKSKNTCKQQLPIGPGVNQALVKMRTRNIAWG